VNETSESRSIAVITARMPYIDRRSLSEAWFSALHLASDGPVSPKPPERRGAELVQPEDRVAGAARNAARQAPERVAAGAPATSRSLRANAEPALPALPNARRARSAAAFARARSYAPFRTSLTLGIEGERVALLLRREGATLHVVALCRPAVSDLVRRALGCADLHLRARGESVCSRVETSPNGAIA
jgi:hypothetical protein